MIYNFGNAKVNIIVGKVNIEDFYIIEAFGVQCKSRCGGCKCGKCFLGVKDYIIQEERELELIECNLIFNSEDSIWIVEYFWIKDSNDFFDNRKVAMVKLVVIE